MDLKVRTTLLPSGDSGRPACKELVSSNCDGVQQRQGASAGASLLASVSPCCPCLRGSPRAVVLQEMKMDWVPFIPDQDE